MRNIKLQMSLFLLLTGFLAQAQQTILTSGGESSGGGGKMSYSIGQVFYSIDEGSTGSITQGMQQAYEIMEISVPGITIINFDISVFPNPTTNLITIKIDNYNNEPLNYYLMDMKGSILDSKAFKADRASVDMSSLPTSTYFIKILYNDKEAKTFKIIKN